eukprot:gnl/MRDRNA2_/MRDRNA2_75128_c0_seq2.p1 gnl/MRDRNA2_/MRDRNA2_75128_c0~~gnl/MRDRNA2_/MRDRNA2_75128_c0_seq2.p1  ORF type:complete len:274 (-),score=16.74 gnl/MRDRNA2_/MRDRNA2_75128_c0_seq2:32-793(-)
MFGPFYAQACQMDLRVSKWFGSGYSSQQFNGAFFNCGDSIAICCAAPFFDRCLFPMLARLQGSDSVVPIKPRVCCGLLCAFIAVVVAACLEVWRRSAPGTGEDSKCAPPKIQMSSVPAIWMFLPYALFGIGEVLINPVLYNAAYIRVPPEMRTLAQGFNLAASGALSTAIASAISSIAGQAWQPDDLNKGHLEYIYVIVAVMLIVATFSFLWLFSGQNELLNTTAFNEVPLLMSSCVLSSVISSHHSTTGIFE